MLVFSLSSCKIFSKYQIDFCFNFGFLFCYFRTFIFPFLIRGGKPTSLTAFVSAVMFCVANGYLQGGYLLKFADFQNVCDAQFYAGT